MYNKNKPLASIAESQYKLAKKLQGVKEYEMPKFYKFDQLKLMQSIASSQKIIVEKYNPEPGPGPEPVSKNYFYIENQGNESISVTITNDEGTGAPFNSIEISNDKENWTELILDNDTYKFDIPATSRVYLRAEQSSWVGWRIYSPTKFNVGGNIMSLLYGDDFEDKTSFPKDSSRNFSGLFNKIIDKIYNGLTDASNLLLPATTLSEECYEYMFSSCTSLTTAPALPATALAKECYSNMFQGCTSLTTAPELPATALVDYCYVSMFHSCSALTTAPELPAANLAEGCYASMFSYCTSLTSVTTCANDISATKCLSDWLDNVAQTGTFYNLGGATYETGASGIPSGWTEETSK